MTYEHILFLCLQKKTHIKWDIRPQMKWAVSLVMADDSFNLHPSFCGMYELTYSLCHHPADGSSVK